MKARNWLSGLLVTVMAVTVAQTPVAMAQGSPSKGVSRSTDLLTRNEAFPFAKVTPAFPAKVSNYVLETQERPEPLRIFKGNSWVVPIRKFNPSRGGTATMSCQPYYWVLRWRSNNPDVTLRATAGLTDGGAFSKIYPSAQGGAGIIEGKSCVVPALKFGRTLRGNQANLVDVNFEYQIWKSQPKI